MGMGMNGTAHLHSRRESWRAYLHAVRQKRGSQAGCGQIGQNITPEFTKVKFHWNISISKVSISGAIFCPSQNCAQSARSNWAQPVARQVLIVVIKVTIVLIVIVIIFMILMLVIKLLRHVLPKMWVQLAREQTRIICQHLHA